jgi:hypothetical protein
MLKKLVQSIIDSSFNKDIIKEVYIIVVDNDENKTAEAVMHELKERYNELFFLDYYCHPLKGISNVRNESIKRALSFNPDFIVFVDDDEWVTPEWLNELVKTILINNADAVRGPAIAVLDKKISENIAYWFKRKTYPNNARIRLMETNNLILNCVSLKKFGIWFDPRFNIIGSGDSYFGIQMLNKGAIICWAADAVVYETIPGSRANLNWLIKRIYRGASTYSYVLKLEKEYLKIIKKIFISVIYILGGILALIITPIPVKKRYWGILKLSEGVGGLTGLFDMLYYEYK